MWKRIVVIAVVAVALYAALLYSQRQTGPLRVSGFIEADEIRVGSRVGGRVKTVAAVEGKAVEAGELLLELEPYNLRQRHAQAEAQLAERRAELARLLAGYRVEERRQAEARVDQWQAQLQKLVNGPRPEELEAARKQVEQADAQFALAEEKHRRAEALLARNAISQQDFDQSQAELRVARTTLEVREQNLQLLEKGTREEEIDEARARLQEAQAAYDLVASGYRKEEVEQARAAVAAAEAALRVIEEELDELTVAAPSDAVVQAVNLQPGDLVAANVPALSLLDLRNLWVRAYVPENRLDIQNGQKVWVTIDSFPGRSFAAHISFVSQQAEFTPRNIQTPEERSKQVFRIKATLDEGRGVLRPGMAADVWFEEPSR